MPLALAATPPATTVISTIGDAIRTGVSGYAAATHEAGVIADRATAAPRASVTTLTGALKDVTSGIKLINRGTSLLHAGAEAGMTALAAGMASSFAATGATARDLGLRIADAIDGRSTAQHWSSIGWGMMNVRSAGEAAVAPSGVGAALAGLGMR